MASRTTTTKDSVSGGWSAAERAAMKEHAAEIKRAGGRGSAKAAEEAQACLDKIAELPPEDRVIAERIHAIVTETAPNLTVKTWYGMPAYAQEGKVLCFFKPASKFGVRYATLGFNDVAALDDGSMWPTEYAVTELTPGIEKKIRTLVKKASG